jgi:hypothetical protein
MNRTLPILAAILASALWALPAAAETREQAVAYAFLGLADNAVLDRGPVHLTWKEVSSSPAVFQGHGEGGNKNYDVRFSVSAAGDCDYEIKLSGAPNVVRGGEALFAKISLEEITAVAPGKFQVTVTGDGYCQTGSLNPNCTVVHNVDIFGALDAGKHAAMVEQVRTAACIRP